MTMIIMNERCSCFCENTGQKLSHSVVIWPRSQSSENVFVIAAVMVSKSAKLYKWHIIIINSWGEREKTSY